MSERGPQVPARGRGVPRRGACLPRRPTPGRLAGCRHPRARRRRGVQHPLAPHALRARDARDRVADAVRRRRTHEARAGGARRGARPGARADGAGDRHDEREDDGQHARALGHGGPEAAVPAADPVGRRRVGAGLLGARSGLRPRVAPAARGARRRRVGGERAEDLDVARSRGQLDVPPRSHRPRRAQEPRHHLPALPPRHPGRRGAADHNAHRRRRVLRGVLHRRSHPTRAT